MRARQVLAAAVATVALAGCGSGEETPAAAPTTTAAQAPVAKAYLKPGADKAYLKAIRAIDESLVDGREKPAVDDGENICLDVSQGEAAAVIEKRTVARFSTDPATARKILAATKKTLCA